MHLGRVVATDPSSVQHELDRDILTNILARVSVAVNDGIIPNSTLTGSQVSDAGA